MTLPHSHRRGIQDLPADHEGYPSAPAPRDLTMRVDPVAVLRELAGPTRGEIRERAARDKERYHPANPRDYASSVGMPVVDKEGRCTGYVCVGCWYCCPAVPGHPKARAALRAMGGDY